MAADPHFSPRSALHLQRKATVSSPTPDNFLPYARYQNLAAQNGRAVEKKKRSHRKEKKGKKKRPEWVFSSLPAPGNDHSTPSTFEVH